MFCRGRIGHGADWSWIALAGGGLAWVAQARIALALDHFVPRKRFTQNNVLSFKSASIYITGNLKNIPDMDLHIETR